MKRIIICIICLAWMLVMAGCTGSADQGTMDGTPGTEYGQQATGESVHTESQPTQTQPDTETGGDYCYNVRFVYLYSLEEYNAYVSEVDDPTLLVVYSDFSEIGTFVQATFSPDAPDGHSYCIYRIMDTNGVSFSLYVDVSDDFAYMDSKVNPLVGTINPDDMRTAQVEEWGYYEYHGIRYCYASNGEDLAEIVWNAHGVEYTIMCHPFSEYPLDTEGSFLSGLLRLDTVEQTLSQVDVLWDEP